MSEVLVEKVGDRAISLKRRDKSDVRPDEDDASKRYSHYSVSDLNISPMPVLRPDYETKLGNKLTLSSAGEGRQKTEETQAEDDVSQETPKGRRLEPVPEAKSCAEDVVSPYRRTGVRPATGEGVYARPVASSPQSVPVPSTEGVLPLTPSTLRLFRRSLSPSLVESETLDRRSRASSNTPDQASMSRSRSFGDIFEGRPLALPEEAQDQQQDRQVLPERGGTLRRSIRALSGSWKNLLKQVGGTNRLSTRQASSNSRRVTSTSACPETRPHRFSGCSFSSSGYGSAVSSGEDDQVLPTSPTSPEVANKSLPVSSDGGVRGSTEVHSSRFPSRISAAVQNGLTFSLPASKDGGGPYVDSDPLRVGRKVDPGDDGTLKSPTSDRLRDGSARPQGSPNSLTSADEVITRCDVARMLACGWKDDDVLRTWLTGLQFEDYHQLFVNAGYDLPTISRMTPEDLTAVGVTSPGDRRRLKTEIGRLQISDGLPEFVPETLETWMELIRLEGYTQALRSQGYMTVQQATEIAWEDLEEIGISKLGHQKRIMLAIKRIKDIESGRRASQAFSQQHSPYTTQEILVPLGSRQSELAGGSELRTFQASVASRTDFSSSAGRYQGLSNFRPFPFHHVQAHVEGSCRGDPPPPPAPQAQPEYFQRYLPPPPGRARSIEDSDLTPANQRTLLTSGTLPRPRPVAAIPATARDASAPGGYTRNYKSLPRDALRRGFSLSPAAAALSPLRKASLGGSTVSPLPALDDFPPPPPPLQVSDSADDTGSDASDWESTSGADTCRSQPNQNPSGSQTMHSSAESCSFPFANDDAASVKAVRLNSSSQSIL